MSYFMTQPRLKQSLVIFSIFSVFYLLVAYFFIGFRIDHIYFWALIGCCYFATKQTNKFTYVMVFFALYWIIYDGLRAVPNYTVNPISTMELYDFEKSHFGIREGGNLYTPNEYLSLHKSKWGDFASGMFYLFWVPMPMAIALYFAFIQKKSLRSLSYTFTFFFVNLCGFVIYYLYPAAPPWYVAKYAATIDFTALSDPAGLVRFDQLIGYPLFANMYTKNSNVFAAMPSLHSAYPVIASYISVKYRLKYFIIFSFVITLGIWFSAVYSFHHYVADVIAGVVTAIFGIVLSELILHKTQLKNWLNKIVLLIETDN